MKHTAYPLDEPKLCECECGRPAPLAKKTNAKLGHIKGWPVRFISGHARRLRPETHYDIDAGGCWVWRGPLMTSGYGHLTRDHVTHAAHRWFYEQHVGAIPVGLQLDHLCRNRACVNPAHLEPVTNTENLRRGALTKLTADDVREIRRSADVPLRALADQYGLSYTYTSSLRRGTGLTWRDVA